ncbi:unnamed protein product [Clonostachys solani]|uniref:Uncharacterized protein n=1 Tax=Clonostachys solani TaxID=160281 RepID=A0A9N9ZJ20_9HYPO|nr:unnamed protein product [Clonostachys solani]
MCFVLTTHMTNCETRHISTLEVEHPELCFDIYNPFTYPDECEHFVENYEQNLALCPRHGTCCQVTFRRVCVFWVGHAGGIIKCRKFKRYFHITVPRGGCNPEVARHFVAPFPARVELTAEEEERLFEAHRDYIDSGEGVRTALEGCGSRWITDVNPPYDWRPTLNVGENVEMLGGFDAARERWESTCPMLKIVEDPPRHELQKEIQSQHPYWYKAVKVPRTGNEGIPLPGAEGFIDDQPTPVESSVLDTEEGDQDVPLPPSSDGPNQIWSSASGEENDSGLGQDDEQGPLAAPQALGGHALPAEPGNGPVEPPANPNLSSEQLSALRDMLVQPPPGDVPGVRLRSGMVGIPVTGMVWLPAQGLLHPPVQAPFHLDNVDDRGYNRAPDGLLLLPADILGRLLNNIRRNIRPENVPIQSVEGENGFAPPIVSPLTDAEAPGGGGEGSRPPESGESQRDEEESATNSNTTRGSGGLQENDAPLPPTQSPSGGEEESRTNSNTTRGSGVSPESDAPLPPTQSPSGGSGQGSSQQATSSLLQSSLLPESGNDADGSQQSGSLLSAVPPSPQEEGNSEEATTELLSDRSNGALEEVENALEPAESDVPRNTRKRAAEEEEEVEEEEEEVEEEPAPPPPTRRQPAKRRRVEQPVEQPIEQPADEPRYRLRQRRKVNYTQ